MCYTGAVLTSCWLVGSPDMLQQMQCGSSHRPDGLFSLVRCSKCYTGAVLTSCRLVGSPYVLQQMQHGTRFCDEDRMPIVCPTAYKILNDQKKLVLTDEFDPSLFTFHSFRIYLATTLAAAGASDPEIQALCRWQSVESLKIYKRFQPRQVCDLLDKAQHAHVESYTAANLPTLSSYEIAAGIHA